MKTTRSIRIKNDIIASPDKKRKWTFFQIWEFSFLPEVLSFFFAGEGAEETWIFRETLFTLKVYLFFLKKLNLKVIVLYLQHLLAILGLFTPLTSYSPTQ